MQMLDEATPQAQDAHVGQKGPKVGTDLHFRQNHRVPPEANPDAVTTLV